MNDLRHPRIPTLFKSDSYSRGTRSSKEQSSSCSSCIGLKVDAKNANADFINIEENELSNNNYAVTDYVNDAEILNIKKNLMGTIKITSSQCKTVALKTK